MPSNKLHTELLISAGVEGLNHIDRVIDALREAGKDTEQLSEESARLRREWDNLDPAERAERMRNLGDATNSASEDARRLGDETERNVGIFGRAKGAILALGTALGVAFVAGKIKAFFTDAVAGAADFEAQLSTVKAVSGASAEEMEKLRGAAEKMGAETKYNATEAAQGLENLARAGLDANESIEALPSVLALAQGNGIELAEAASYITQAASGMGLAMSESARVADVLAKAASSANTDIQGMGQALAYAAPTAASLGLTIEETAAYIGKFADAGIDGSRAGTALNNMMAQFANPASTFKRELSAIGIRTTDFNQAIRELATAGPKGQAAINALGMEAGPAFKALLGQGIGALDELTAKLEKASGFAGEQAAEMGNNLKGAFDELSSAWDAVKQQIGAPILDPLKEKIKELAGVFVQNFNFGALIDKVRGGFEALSTAGSVLSTVWNGLAVVANALKAGFAGIAWTVSYIAEAAALAAHGIVGIITTITDFFGATDNATAGVIESIEAVQHAARETRRELEDMAANAGEGMVSGLKSMVGAAEESTDQAAAAFGKIPAAAEDAAAKSVNPMVAMYQKVVDKVLEVTDTAKKEAEKQAKAAEEAAQRTKEAQEQAAVAAKDAFAGFGVDLDEVLTGVSAKAKKAMGDYTHAVQQATDAGLDATKAARAGFEALAEKLESPAEWAAFKKHLIDSGQGLDHLTKNQLKRMEDNIKGLPDVAATAMQQLKQRFENADIGDLSRLKAETEAAYKAGEISGKQYAEVLEELKAKTDALRAKTSSAGDTAAQAHGKAAAAAKSSAKAKDENAAAEKKTADATEKTAEATEKSAKATEKSADAEKKNAAAKAESVKGSFALYDATNLNAEALKKLNGLTAEFGRRFNAVFRDGVGTGAEVSKFGRDIHEFANQLRRAQAAIDDLNASTAAGTVTMNEISETAIRAQNTIFGLDNTTLNNLNAAIDAARQKLRDMKQEAEDTRASLEAQLASLRGDDSVAQSLNEQKRLRELNIKLQEAEAKGQQEIAAEYRRAIELQKQVFDEERRQQQQRKAEEAKRKQEAEQRKSSTSGNRNTSSGKDISAEEVVEAFDERIAEAEKRGANNLALALREAAKRRPR